MRHLACRGVRGGAARTERSRQVCACGDRYLYFITVDHKKLLKNSTFVGNTGHFDNEVDFAGSEGLDIKPQKIAPAFQSSLPRFADEAFEWVFRTFPRFQKSAESRRQCGDDPAGGHFHAERSSNGSCRSRRALQLMDAGGL